MTTFQAIIYSIIHSFSLFLPIDHQTHQWFLSYLLGWNPSEGVFAGVLMLGSVLALLIYFRHDWASIISSGLRVVLLWKKPMTLDERTPFFLFLTAIPTGLAWYYFSPYLQNLELSPYWYAASLVLFGLPLILAHSMNRRTKNMFNWNWSDSLIVGITQILVLVPGAGRQVGALSGALFRNYHLDAAAKFVFFSFLPILMGESYLLLRDLDFAQAEPTAGMSWLTFWTALAVSTLTGLLAIGGFNKNLTTQGGFGGYLLYRVILALGIVAVAALR